MIDRDFIKADIGQCKEMLKSSIEAGDIIAEVQFTRRIKRLELELENDAHLTPQQENLVDLNTIKFALEKIEEAFNRVIAALEQRAKESK